MKTVSLFFLLICLFFSKSYSQTLPAWEWATNASLTYDDQISKDICAQGGNVFVLGNNKVQTSVNNTPVPAGNFIAKYGSGGSLQWMVGIPGTGKDIKADKAGNLFVAGNFTGTISQGSTTLTSNGKQDLFVMKLTSNGSLDWIRSFGSTEDDATNAILPDNKGNVFVTGYFNDLIQLDNYQLAPNMAGGNKRQTFYVAKLNTSGIVTWTSVGDTNYQSDEGWSLYLDRSENLYCGGFCWLAPCEMFCRTGLLMKYDAAGALKLSSVELWTDPDNIVVDQNGDIIMLGEAPANNHTDWKLVKYDSLMNRKWIKEIGTTYTCFSSDKGLGIDRWGNLYTMGLFGRCEFCMYDSIDYEGQRLYVKGKMDLVMSMYDADGQHVWSKNNGGSAYVGNQYPSGSKYGNMCMDDEGNCFATSIYFTLDGTIGDVSFDGKKVTSDGTWPQAFVAKLGSASPLGIQETREGTNTVNIYPNPSSGKFVLQVNGSTGAGKVTVYDMEGRCIYMNAKTAGEIDLGNTKSGVYLLKLEIKEKVYHQKVIVSTQQ
jgi:hypothetical protein